MDSRLDPKHFGLALGLTCGLATLALGILATYFGWGIELVSLMGTVYHGYNATFFGAFIGAGWALVKGYLLGWLFAWFYNKLK